MENTIVSVIIPTYNRAKFLHRAIESVLNQTYRNVEIIVVDDNDPDSEGRKSTEVSMKPYINSEKIKYVKHEHNKNGSAARNTGFRYSNGEYIMFLDDDDEFYPRKIEAQVNCMDSHDLSFGACYSRYVDMSPTGKIQSVCAEKREGALLVEELKRNLFIHAGSNLMVRRSVVEELNGFDETFNRNQDVEFVVRLLQKYKLAFADEMGLIVHAHKPVATAKFEEATENFLCKFKNVIETLSEDDQHRIYKMINLQLFRYRICESGSRRDAYQMLKDRRVRLLSVVSYGIHLVIRKLTKKSYGYTGIL